MRKVLLSLAIALLLVLVPVIPAFAATTADVTVTATPASVIAITDNATGAAFGEVADGATVQTTTAYIHINNTSNVQVDMTISVTTSTWAGGVTWTHDDTGSPGADTAGLKANRGGTWGVGDVVVKNVSPLFIYENCPAGTDFDYGLQLLVPTSTTDVVEKSNTVRVSAAAG
jgi:hypothetical protein